MRSLSILRRPVKAFLITKMLCNLLLKAPTKDPLPEKAQGSSRERKPLEMELASLQFSLKLFNGPIKLCRSCKRFAVLANDKGSLPKILHQRILTSASVVQKTFHQKTAHKRSCWLNGLVICQFRLEEPRSRLIYREAFLSSKEVGS